MKKIILALAAAIVLPSWALALPGSSVYPDPKKGPGPNPCSSCHKNNAEFEKNIYIDVRDDKGVSLINKEGAAEIPFRPGESTVVDVVVGIKDPDPKAKVAGWFVNLPMGAALVHGSVNYCYQRLNYEVHSQFAVDNTNYRTHDKHVVTFHRYFSPAETELWVGVGGKATDTEPGSDARKGTLGLKNIKLKWVKDINP
ncbi:MAG: hypothetical protein HZB29_04670 [Nitrospinae bacterium]|nr:hypothetical protein [Nitrospinota bacterium]